MKQYLLLLAISLFVYQANAQPKAQSVPGTKVSLVPPDGFVPATNFTGFIHSEKKASLVVVEMPAPFDKVTLGMTEENFKKGGMQLIAKDTIVFHESTALLITVTQTANGMEYKKMILGFGDSNHTTMINAIYPTEMEDLEQPLKKSLLTTTYNAAQVSDPVGAAPFEVHPELHGFKFASSMMGMLSYTLDGKTVSEHPDKASFIAGSSVGKVAVSDNKIYAIGRFKKLPDAALFEITDADAITINNLEGIELVALNKQTQELFYQVMLFTNENTYYIMVGKADKKVTTYLEQFKIIARTFRRK